MKIKPKVGFFVAMGWTIVFYVLMVTHCRPVTPWTYLFLGLTTIGAVGAWVGITSWER